MKGFGSRELVKCLKRLGFKEQPQVGSRHLKFTFPNPVEKGIRSFIIVIQNKKVFDPHIQKEYIKKIKANGFSNVEIEVGMK